MRKAKLILFAMVLIINILAVNAYQNCTPSACPSGYTDNGTTCSGNTCTKQCYVSTCSGSWTSVYNSGGEGWDTGANEDFAEGTDGSYTPSDTSYCYKYMFDAPPASDAYIELKRDPGASCQADVIGGFWDTTAKSNPWFINMTGYLGSVSNARYDYLLKTVRAHSDLGGSTYASDTAGFLTDASEDRYIYCAPSNTACDQLDVSEYWWQNCSTACYNKGTQVKAAAGLFTDIGSDDYNVYQDSFCGNANADINRYGTGVGSNDFYLRVYSSPATNITYDNQECYRTNEAPNATGVKVLPEDANAGQDLICNYTYEDAEGFEERDSTYEWWKNGADQSINYQILGKGNLTPDDGWYCKVTPSDGLANGTKVQSSNTVNISSTVQNPAMYVEDAEAWSSAGYFGDKETVLDFNQEIDSALDSCADDEEGYCNISLTFGSDAVGLLNLTGMEIFYKFPEPEVSSITITELSSMYSSGTRHVFHFTILNNGDTDLTNLNWTMDFGDENSAYSIYPFNLTSGKDILVLVEYEYADNESHTVTANANAGTLSASKQTTVGGASDLQINSFTELYSMGRLKTWQFFIKNNGQTNLTDIYWNITGTDSPISSIYPINLTVNESIIVIVGENLTNYQQYTITAKAFTDTTSTTETLSARGKELEVSGIKEIYTNGLVKTLEFLITNTYTSAINNLNWSFYTGEEIINSVYPFNLTASENIKVIIENNYSSSGNKALNFSVKSSSYEDSENKNITV